MGGIAGITSRIGYIEGQLAALRAGVLTGAPNKAATEAHGAAFAQTLATASKDAATKDAGSMSLAASTDVALGKAKLNAKGVPTDLATYGNGRIPAHALREVGTTDHRL